MYNEATGDEPSILGDATIHEANDSRMQVRDILISNAASKVTRQCCTSTDNTKHDSGCRRGRRERDEAVTFAFVKAELNAVGMSIRKNDGEYTVYPIGTWFMHGYFTTSLIDALTTGRIMSLSIAPVTHVTTTLALIDPFQPMAHEQDAWGGRLSASQRRQWAALELSQLGDIECNLIAKLLEDRASECTRNAIQCRELYAGETSDYWTSQSEHASTLAVQFRNAGK